MGMASLRTYRLTEVQRGNEEMATTPQQDPQREELRKIIAECESYSREDLIRGDLDPVLGFESAKGDVQAAFALAQAMARCDLDMIPSQNLNVLRDLAVQARDTFRMVKEFDPAKYRDNPLQIRDQAIQRLQNLFRDQFARALPFVAYSAGGLGTLSELNEVMGKSRDLLGEIQTLRDKAKQAVQEVGLATHAAHFQEEARNHSRYATAWLAATAIMLVITVCFAWFSFSIYLKLPDSMTTTQTIQFGIAKLVIFSFLFSSLVWMGRVYRAHRHNYVVNKHRHNALMTFETFVKSAGDEQTKSAVLLQATNCIFSPQSSGYITHEGDTATYPQILEIVRGIAGSQEKA